MTAESQRPSPDGCVAATARLRHHPDDTLRSKLEQDRRWDGVSDEWHRRQLLEQGRCRRMSHHSNRRTISIESLRISAKRPSVILVVGFKQFVTHLLNGPLGIDLFVLNFVDDAIDKRLVLGSEMRIDQEGRFGSLRFFNCSCIRRNCRLDLSTDCLKRSFSSRT
jgi:hypothetical protein